MGLCSLCQSVDFNSLLPLPAHYEGYHEAWKNGSGLIGFISPRLGEARKTGRDLNAGEFSQPLGVAHHQSMTELTAAAQNCSICRLIEHEVSGYLAARTEAEKDDVYAYYETKRDFKGPNYRLWLTRRRDDCDGFLVVSPDAFGLGQVWLLAGIGFCVEDDDPLAAVLPGRVIQEDPTCEKTLARAVGFVHECDAQHKCSMSDGALPNRVLDITSQVSPNGIRLVEPDGIQGKYAALSHRWGDRNPSATTRANLEAYKEGLPVDELPKSFQDAITVTRKLGLRYLWIDALSICQDDGSEWERESSKMASIYSRAYVVLAATGAHQDSQGLFFSRTPPTYHSFEYIKDGIAGTIHTFAIPKNERAAYARGYAVLHDEPLSNRGWVLQERVLATRTLHFASDQMLFECYGHCRSEDGFRMSGRINDILQHSKPGISGQSNNDAKASMFRGPSLWYDLLNSYSRRKLTKKTDKLPALSGLARVVEEQIGDEYVAGLWRSTLLEGILWQAIGTHRGATNASPVYRAPSWSWASIDGSFGNLGLGKDLRYISEDGEWSDIGTILDCHVELKGENPYGEVKSGWLKIKAPVEPLSPSEEKEPDHETVPHKRALRMKTKTGKPFGTYCMFDTIDDDSALQLSLSALLLAYIERKKSGRTFQALIVTPVEGQEGYYRRVGKIIFNDESIGNCDWMQDQTEMETITLL
ncbi:HET-domain-containing protein [Lentithecium fluviatile CBS 122367]|uniref:HET-domain-containing protein n=1 Tax=Lentithecium fluviatile CBS 122367 TaxID=1168545 RepID=A0A6G1J9Z0_9PLEO|nr:HET-domain-containing protein [Lentithecium fluviatile CBS 122367]